MGNIDRNKLSWTNIFMTAGAFISYTVGSGFASGNEVLQFYGSWGAEGTALAIFCGVITAAIYCVSFYLLGRQSTLVKPTEVYLFLGGRTLGWIYQIFVYVFILSCFMLMFSGAANVLYQEFGVAKWLGAVLLGSVSLLIVLKGLKTVEKVLGWAGIILLGYTLVFATVSVLNPQCSIGEASFIKEAVATGQIWQANLFALFPFSLFPGLTAMNGPVVEGTLYPAVCLVSGSPFYFTLGKRAASNKEAIVSGIVTAVSFFTCVCFSLLIMLMNGSKLIDFGTGKMYEIPLLAAVDFLWPAGSWTYSLIIFIGIFTTTTGYLWVINDLLFPGHDEGLTAKGRLLVLILTIIGIFFGGLIPFSVLINLMFPICGIVGLMMTISAVGKVLFKI